MSISSLTTKIVQLQKELADLQKKMSLETKSENDKFKRTIQIQSSITKSTSLSTIQSKQREIQRCSDDIAKIQIKKADISKKIADKNSQLLKAQTDLWKEQENERRRADQAQKRREQESLRHQQLITQELALQKQIAKGSVRITTHLPDAEFDIFISHASEDKDDFVRPLASKLSEI